MDKDVLTVETDVIIHTTRKLKVEWSLDVQQDLSFNLDSMNELAEIMAKEIQAEIDKEIIDDLSAFKAKKSIQDKPIKGLSNKNSKIIARPIDDDWEVSKID